MMLAMLSPRAIRWVMRVGHDMCDSYANKADASEDRGDGEDERKAAATTSFMFSCVDYAGLKGWVVDERVRLFHCGGVGVCRGCRYAGFLLTRNDYFRILGYLCEGLKLVCVLKQSLGCTLCPALCGSN